MRKHELSHNYGLVSHRQSPVGNLYSWKYHEHVVSTMSDTLYCIVIASDTLYCIVIPIPSTWAAICCETRDDRIKLCLLVSVNRVFVWIILTINSTGHMCLFSNLMFYDLNDKFKLRMNTWLSYLSASCTFPGCCSYKILSGNYPEHSCRFLHC